MEKEILKNKNSSLSVNVVAGEVESLRKVVEETSTVRVYEDGFVGIAGQIGVENMDRLEAEAIANLQNKMPYPCELSEGRVEDVDGTKDIFNPDEFMHISKSLLKRIAEAAPRFLINNKIQYYVTEKSYENSKGTKLSYKGNEYYVALMCKDKNSANLFDMDFSVNNDVYDEDQIIDYVKLLEKTYFNPVDIEAGKYKVILSPGELLGTSLQNFVGELYVTGASLFKDKLGEKIFSDKLSVLLDRTPGEKINVCFFDAEGEVADDYKSYIVKDGVFCGVLTSKKVSANYGLPLSKSSEADYDSIPSAGAGAFTVADSGKTLAELIGDEKAIYVNIASGGDTTTDGDFATPVQTAFLYEGGKLVGKLPDLKIYGNVFDFLGDDFVGVTKQHFAPISNESLMVVRLNVDK